MVFLFGFINRRRSVVRKLVVQMANFIVDGKENLDSTVKRSLLGLVDSVSRQHFGLSCI
jgi:hypothetical protein